MKEYFKFIGEHEIGGGRILLYPITSEDIESRTDKKFNDKELYRIFMALCCVDSIRENIEKAVDEAISLALDDSEPLWEDIDEKYNCEVKCLSTYV